MKHFAILLVCLFQSLACAQQDAETLKLAAPISDHMVLQHGASTSVWGTAKPDSKVSVSFADQSVETETDGDGRWSVSLAPLEISTEPATLKVTSSEGETISVNDVLVGEVWMCSGQSNMAWTLQRTGDPMIDQIDLPLVRLFKTDSATSDTVQTDCGGDWKVAKPNTAADFSAVGFHFGRELHAELKVPVGLIDTSWGGKPVEAFTSREKLLTVEDAIPLVEEWDNTDANYDAAAAKSRFEAAMEKWKAKRDEIVANTKEGVKPKLPRRPQMQGQPKLDTRFPGAIYNQKVAPWTKYAVAGSIWYQGESNAGRAVQYESLLTALIEDWRAKWNNESMPFYIVQLANFKKPTDQPGIRSEWAELQHFQTRVAQSIPNCGIAVINDIGDTSNIHPKNKRDVGHRLALLALKKHYDKDLEVFSSPLYKSHSVADDHILVTLDHVGSGLKSRDGEELKRFEVAGSDMKWHWAKAEIVAKDTIKLSSAEAPQPVAARYAWAANPEGANLVNSGDLPASLFRTDTWPLKTQGRLTLRQPTQTERQMAQRGFTPLFNGRNLDGWRNPYDFGKAKVVNNEIHLTANKKFFLVTEKKFSDFVLFVEINLPEGQANSGVMFRCHVEPNRVYGYQAECDGSDRRWSAGLYDEGRRGWVWPSKEGRSNDKKMLEYAEESQAHFAKPEVRGALKRTDWNRYKITCKGNKISIELNGVKVTDVEDDTDAEGFIGIQHHGEKGQTYRFRNIFIKELK
ncbi:family 16 glycoside hydrolase [Mariniblastus fucicola]|nr:family 16 glycoside hydrolase [Mariniblastus fucicola]